MNEELLNVGIGHNAIEQVLVGFVFAEVKPLLEVVFGDGHGDGDDEGLTVLAAQLDGVNFFALEDIDCNAQAGGADARGIGNADGFKIGVGLFDLVPEFQILAAAFADHHGEFGGIGSHDSL